VHEKKNAAFGSLEIHINAILVFELFFSKGSPFIGEKKTTHIDIVL